MTQQDVYEKFKVIFPQFTKFTREWFPNGKHSIRVRLSSEQDYIFTYHSLTEWSFETVDMFLNKIR